ncbi:glycosyltransferase [Flavobacterium cyanobacteriorum]|jgi:rSAM/selenodomain-associated transferase 1|uniref:Glycosyltransferase n=3 Tax=Flavobacterium TaxID=237 RepID=A0A256A651_9FLAO|nr:MULTISPECIES: TIGR04282 family arsenosugar biosynthesis glycosyltransferase [Flavobacterium]MBM6499805.1 TIGR04282 family arsenosugar biosynthesis glycosyltransferase [Flavobacterium macrobrachii]OYQ37593.1 glycosyltransferase [Flavobacterium cyanobacteriorum]OYQ49226.1 glycosyltransferase [Flavobacterium aurantiibacter]
MEKKLVLVFTRNPELGKVKTRLAATIGEKNALEVYVYLLTHTKNCISQVNATKRVLYSEAITLHDIWDNTTFEKDIQQGTDLGMRMQHAFEKGFEDGFNKIVIVGSDLPTLDSKDIEDAFLLLDTNEVVIGPAEDGGYYLLGLKSIPNGIFENKNWGTNSVLADTLTNLSHIQTAFIKMKNDIDTIEDIKNIPEFQKYL